MSADRGLAMVDVEPGLPVRLDVGDSALVRVEDTAVPCFVAPSARTVEAVGDTADGFERVMALISVRRP